MSYRVLSVTKEDLNHLIRSLHWRGAGIAAAVQHVLSQPIIWAAAAAVAVHRNHISLPYAVSLLHESFTCCCSGAQQSSVGSLSFYCLRSTAAAPV